MRFPALGFFYAACIFGAPTTQAAMSFSLVFTAQAQSDYTAAEQALFTDGMDYWDSIIDGHRDGASRNWTLTVDSFSTPYSGGGTTLGFANVSGVAFSGAVAGSHTGNGRFIISTAGAASFNVHEDAGDLNLDTIRHEIGHALGIGTLWEDNEIYNDGVAGNHNRTLTGGTPGQLVGPATLAAYKAEFDATATFVPVELDGGTGTAHRHWNEAKDNWNSENVAGFDSDPGDGGPAPTGNGRSMDDEIMTGVQTSTSWISFTTVASLEDIGFTIHADAIPEPGTTALFAATLLLLAAQRRRS